MTRKTISVRINGKDTQIDHDLTIAQLLGQLEINIKLIAVALNGVVTNSSNHYFKFNNIIGLLCFLYLVIF